jgi:hypothetical protein
MQPTVVGPSVTEQHSSPSPQHWSKQHSEASSQSPAEHGGAWQSPLLQNCSLAAQASPQSPQLRGSFSGLTQLPPQQMNGS